MSAAIATRSRCGGREKTDLEIIGNLCKNKSEYNLQVKVLGDGEGDLEAEG